MAGGGSLEPEEKSASTKISAESQNTSPVCEGHPYTYVHLPIFTLRPRSFFLLILLSVVFCCIVFVVVLVESEEERANTGDHQQYYRG